MNFAVEQANGKTYGDRFVGRDSVREVLVAVHHPARPAYMDGDRFVGRDSVREVLVAVHHPARPAYMDGDRFVGRDSVREVLVAVHHPARPAYMGFGTSLAGIEPSLVEGKKKKKKKKEEDTVYEELVIPKYTHTPNANGDVTEKG
eukprot:258834_1